MGVIVGLSLRAGEFELGRILGDENDSDMRLEAVVPLGKTIFPLVRVYGRSDDFRERVRTHPSVDDVRVVMESDDQAMYALEWDGEDDSFVGGLQRNDGIVLSATRREDQNWVFEVLFETADLLSAFQAHCNQHDIVFQLDRVAQSPASGHDRDYGLTAPQREALIAALEQGYYGVPRKATVKDLADQLGISDQAVTERLRRATINLGSNTVLRGVERE